MRKVNSPDDGAVPSDRKANIRQRVVEGQLDANAATRLLLEIDKATLSAARLALPAVPAETELKR
ncbi:MAG TPA: hypothetical protein VFC93_17790 [Chloroflexota bacterium]|nr:hypothetical protein [Chloroflexota bacterium]